MPEILDRARAQVLADGAGLDETGILEVLRLPDEDLPELLQVAHDVRMAWCGPEVEVEGIVSLKTGGCPEDCHFCSQSGLFTSPVRSVWQGIREAVDIQAAASLGMLTQEQVDELVEMGVHRYNHNLETCRSYFPNVVTTHSWEERWGTLKMVRDSGMEVCCGGILGLGETVEQRAEFAAQLAELDPHEVPMNFLNPRPGTPLGDRPVVEGKDALRAIAAFRLAMPKTILRYAGGREITLGDLGTRDGLLGGINAVIVGNYLTTLGRPATSDLELLEDLKMPVKALSQTL